MASYFIYTRDKKSTQKQLGNQVIRQCVMNNWGGMGVGDVRRGNINGDVGRGKEEEGRGIRNVGTKMRDIYLE